MLELSKKILEGVSFDRHLFLKELKKAIQRLNAKEEVIKLKSWCYDNFNDTYGRDLDQVFVLQKISA